MFCHKSCLRLNHSHLNLTYSIKWILWKISPGWTGGYALSLDCYSHGTFCDSTNIYICPPSNKKKDTLQENVRTDGVAETSSAATLTTGITEVGSSSLVNQDPLLHASDGLDSASQTNDQDTASPSNQAKGN